MIAMVTRETVRSKICLLGDAAVGKTSTIRRYVLDKFDDKYIVTIGTKLSKKDITYRFTDSQILLTLLIWDIIGQKEFKRLHSMYYSGAKGAIVVCDITRKETLESVHGWISSIFKVTGEIPLVIIGNKNDLKDRAELSSDDVQRVASKYDAPFFFTSAKTGENVDQTFKALGKRILNELDLTV